MNSSEFYVGYYREAPLGLARFIRPVTAALVAGAVALASLIAAGQMPFPPSSFEFGVAQNFSGVLSLKPYPVLFEHGRAHVLFGSGKHGFTTSAPNGAGVTLRGSAVFFGPARGIEVTPGTLQVSGADTPPLPDPRNLGWATLTGEIVDSKCSFGVMNPGRGKVHRDCAVRCISGGIPPALLVRDSAGRAESILLSGIPKQQLLPYVAERLRVSGELVRRGTLLVLNAAPSTLKRE